MHPILGRFGPFLFYSYTTLLGLGLLASVALTFWRVHCRPAIAPVHWLDGIIIGLLLALVAGRAGFVADHWAYFQIHAGESWRLWRGGLSYHAALPAGALGIVLWCRHRACSLRAYADLLAPAGALWSAFGWAACWLEGCAYGRETFLGPLAADLPDSFGVYAVRYQTQLAGLAVSLLALLLYWHWQRKLPPGAGFWLVAGFLSSGRAVISLYRGDLQPFLGVVSATTLADAALALLAWAGFLLTCRYWSVQSQDTSQTKSSKQ